MIYIDILNAIVEKRIFVGDNDEIDVIIRAFSLMMN
jgi:hypothetical protein